jgi:hypothetical protein
MESKGSYPILSSTYFNLNSLIKRLTRSEAGPSKPRVEISSPAALEGVVLLEAPSDEPLVRELRDMVVGKTVLNEAKRA